MELLREIRNGANIQQLRDIVPSQLAEKVVPVMEVNPRLLKNNNIVKNLAVSTTGASTIYTTPATRDFYITGFYINGKTDVANDGVLATIGFTIDKTAQSLYVVRFPPLVVQYITSGFYLCQPIKVDRSTNITANLAFTAGTCAFTFGVFGYTVDD